MMTKLRYNLFSECWVLLLGMGVSAELKRIFVSRNADVFSAFPMKDGFFEMIKTISQVTNHKAKKQSWYSRDLKRKDRMDEI